eukprot:6201052-Pleurochrysis_carterae.AAC.5
MHRTEHTQGITDTSTSINRKAEKTKRDVRSRAYDEGGNILHGTRRGYQRSRTKCRNTVFEERNRKRDPSAARHARACTCASIAMQPHDARNVGRTKRTRGRIPEFTSDERRGDLAKSSPDKSRTCWNDYLACAKAAG